MGASDAVLYDKGRSGGRKEYFNEAGGRKGGGRRRRGGAVLLLGRSGQLGCGSSGKARHCFCGCHISSHNGSAVSGSGGGDCESGGAEDPLLLSPAPRGEATSPEEMAQLPERRKSGERQRSPPKQDRERDHGHEKTDSGWRTWWLRAGALEPQGGV